MYIKSSDNQSHFSTHVLNEHQKIQRNDDHDTQTLNLSKNAQNINLIEGAEQSKILTNHSQEMNAPSGSSLVQLDKIALQRPVTPRACDILSGRGGFTSEHYGNRVYREVVSGHKHDYVHAKKLDKESIAKEVMAEVLDRLQVGDEEAPRFIKKVNTAQSGDKWSPLSEKETLIKIKQSLREGMSHLKKKMTTGLADNVGDKASPEGSLKRDLTPDFSTQHNSHQEAPSPAKRQKTSESSDHHLNPEASVSVAASQDKPHAEQRYDFDELDDILPDDLDSVSEFMQLEGNLLFGESSLLSDLMSNPIELSPEEPLTHL